MPQLLIWPLKISVSSDHCCFVMLHRRPRGGKATQGLPFISACVPLISPDTNSVTAELHFQVEILAKVQRKFHGIHFLYWAAVCAVCASVNVSYSRENASIQHESAPTQTPHYRHSWVFQCMFAFFFSSYMLLVRGRGVLKRGGFHS